MKIIEIKDLVKKYDDFVAVDNVNLSIEEGEIFGLLGPNGAGKSTVINVICGLLNANSGEVRAFDKELKKNFNYIKSNLGLVPQNLALYSNFTAYENIKLFAELYGLRGQELKDKIEEALEFTGLLEMKDKKAEKFSGGMMRRLNMACAIVHKPKLIIMDEPTVGIDPQSRNHILESIKELNRRGTTIIYTSHYMEEVEAICHRVAIMDHGKIIVEGTAEELKSIVDTNKVLSLTVNDLGKINLEELKKINGIISIDIEENTLIITSKKEVHNLDLIISNCAKKEVKIRDIGYRDITLETVFLSLTGRSLRE